MVTKEQAASGELTFVTRALIDGRFVDSASGKTYPIISPSTGGMLTEVAECDAVDIDAAVSAARRSFEARDWSGQPPGARKRQLMRLAEAIRANAEELAFLITLDMGKPISDSRGEVAAAGDCVQYYGEAIDKLYGEVAPTDSTYLTLVTREPVGVVGAIVPWNYPLVLTCWKLAPALAAGNSIVIKPSEKAPLANLRLAELVAETEMPDGVVNFVPGFGDPAGKSLALHSDVDAITFTGSGAVGRLILGYAGASNMKAVSLECGGKSPNIVLADVPDMNAAVEASLNGAYENAGQMCNAATRLLVQDRIADEFIEKVLATTPRFAPADPLDPGTVMGAMVDEAQMHRVLGYIGNGVEEGATLTTGGHRTQPKPGGFYIEPTVFTDVANEMTIAREEIFGPVLSVIRFSDVDEAVRIGNDSIYGLAAAVWTTDITKAHTIARELRAGSVYVNCYDRDDPSAPFGGYKQSGLGREKSLHAIDHFTQLKTTWVNLG
jgi:acyl-CoA reductase-like NAD-dependent aldehyde dehydrogenase